jgi:glycosyltransferase involved in cell wall biosynthesis
MKIAIVVPGGLHPSGEREVVPSWLALFERLAVDHQLHAFVLKRLHQPQSYTLKGFAVHDLGRPSAPPGLVRWTQERALTRALDEHGPFDLVHGFFADPAGRLAARAGQRLTIPGVVTCDSGEFIAMPQIDYGSQRTARGRRAVAEACALATRVHVCTRFMAALAQAQGINSVVIPLTSVTSGHAQSAAASHSSHEEPFRIMQVASLSRVKNQRAVIDALQIVRRRINARLDLIGEDTLGGELQQHAASIGLGAHVFFHGFLPQPQVVERLRTADLYFQSSLHEAAGVSDLEAAAVGVPTVGTRAGHVADWAPSHAMALGDAHPESLAAAILAMHADPEARRRIGAAARTVALAQDASYSAMQFDQLYRSLAR